MSKTSKSDQTGYEVGYGKPPAATRFAKGRSGNPSGRPKKKRGIAESLQAALNQKIAITINGRRRHIAARDAYLQMATKEALSGDIKFVRFLEGLAERYLNQVTSEPLDSEQDLEILNQIANRLAQRNKS